MRYTARAASLGGERPGGTRLTGSSACLLKPVAGAGEAEILRRLIRPREMLERTVSKSCLRFCISESAEKVFEIG